MQNLRTEIIINAPIERVWDLLTDFARYPEWNPFITSFEGRPEEGKRFRVTLRPPGSKPMTFTPKCLKMETNREFRWLGHLGIKGLFDGEHIFELEEIGEGETKFVHREKFKGILVPFLWKQINSNTRRGFELMNLKIKELAETWQN